MSFVLSHTISTVTVEVRPAGLAARRAGSRYGLRYTTDRSRSRSPTRKPAGSSHRSNGSSGVETVSEDRRSRRREPMVRAAEIHPGISRVTRSPRGCRSGDLMPNVRLSRNFADARQRRVTTGARAAAEPARCGSQRSFSR
jgi:hypothetical protein